MKPGHKTKVMMLDDERFLLDIYKISFEKHHFEVVIFNETDAALSALRGGYEPDVILFDITMPDSSSGYEFIESVHREKLAPRALKLALTNEGTDGVLVRLRELGMDEHLLKSRYLPAELIEKVEDMLKAKKHPFLKHLHF